MSQELRILGWRLGRWWRRAMVATCRRLYRDEDGPALTTVLVAGTARSGTTWLGEIIASAGPARLMFEPFYPQRVEACSHFPEFLYMRPGDAHADLAAFWQRVLEGRIRDPWIDHQVDCLRPQLRVVKEVRANFLLRWLMERFPAIRPVLILRHPCAVVQSRMALGWHPEQDLQAYLSQPRLVEDFLADRMVLIEGARTPEEKHAILWCISYLVPLRQFGRGALPAVFYEHLMARPEAEIARAFALAGVACPPSALAAARRPSLTSKPYSGVVTGRDPLTRWQARLSSGQVNRILATVQNFELGHLYNESTMPLAGAEVLLAPVGES